MNIPLQFFLSGCLRGKTQEKACVQNVLCGLSWLCLYFFGKPKGGTKAYRIFCFELIRSLCLCPATLNPKFWSPIAPRGGCEIYSPLPQNPSESMIFARHPVLRHNNFLGIFCFDFVRSFFVFLRKASGQNSL